MTTSSQRTSRSFLDDGFTLIEMMTVISIILVAFGLMAPSLADAFNKRKLSTAGRMIVNKMGEARRNAVTRKQSYSIVFLQRGLQLFREPKGEDFGGWEGGIQAFEYGKGEPVVKYDLQCANLTYEDLPEVADDPEDGEGLADSGNLYITFKPDGTVDFQTFGDIGTTEYNENRDADILIRQRGMLGVLGYLDVRPTGRVMFKIEETDDEE